jgi:DNA adenine methylase
MKPIIKYQGGKTKELPIIKQLAPSTYKRIVEPFCGGAAVSLYYSDACILNDINTAVINLYKEIAGDNYNEIQKRIAEIKCYEHDELEKEYYVSRNIINSPENYTTVEYAIAYIVVRQLCFSGMERYNSNGKYNVPFGHYKKMACNLSPAHHTFFKEKVELYNDDAISVIEQCDENDWIFLDPPYLDRLGYSNGDGGKLHIELVDAMKKTKSKWLFIHSACDFYKDELCDFNIQTEEFKYMQNFGKGKDHSGSKVQHLYITNYD